MYHLQFQEWNMLKPVPTFRTRNKLRYYKQKMLRIKMIRLKELSRPA